MVGILEPSSPKKDATSKWRPRLGENSRSFIESLPNKKFSDKAKQKLTNETYLILSSCHNPSKEDPTPTTGLVVGRVQSGKTTSFKALTMMAMDNGFEFFILFAGRTNNLINQNMDEFEKLKIHKNLLTIEKVKKPSDWKKVISLHANSIKSQGSVSGKPLILITNKHAGHIRAIGNALRDLEIFNDINSMIIDDEADNASLNTAKNKDDDYSASSIYKSIKRLRTSLKKHSVVQYTATPQSLLLISKKDHYSPEWARVISPGDSYVGAKDLFSENSTFFKEVPFEETSSVKI